MPASDGIRLVMDMAGRIIRVQNDCFSVGWSEMKYARFTVIDPDRRMIMMFRHGIPFLPVMRT